MTTLPLQSEYLFRMTLGVGTPQMIGNTRNGELRIVPVTGGTVVGPKLNGEIMPGSAADWLRVDPDGSAQIDVRLTIRAASGSMVFLAYNGIRHGSPAALAKLAAGEAVDPSEIYFRTLIRFETGASDLAWMNKIIAVGVGQRLGQAGQYRRVERIALVLTVDREPQHRAAHLGQQFGKGFSAHLFALVGLAGLG